MARQWTPFRILVAIGMLAMGIGFAIDRESWVPLIIAIVAIFFI